MCWDGKGKGRESRRDGIDQWRWSVGVTTGCEARQGEMSEKEVVVSTIRIHGYLDIIIYIDIYIHKRTSVMFVFLSIDRKYITQTSYQIHPTPLSFDPSCGFDSFSSESSARHVANSLLSCRPNAQRARNPNPLDRYWIECQSESDLPVQSLGPIGKNSVDLINVLRK